MPGVWLGPAPGQSMRRRSPCGAALTPGTRAFCCLFLAAATTALASSGDTGAAAVMHDRAYLTLLPNPRGAVCLDGSPPALYFKPGMGDGASQWLLYLQGGAWCWNLPDCEVRLSMHLGSTLALPAWMPLNGILSTGVVEVVEPAIACFAWAVVQGQW